MSEADVQVVRQAGEAFTERGADGLLDFVDPQVEWKTREDLPDADIYRGHEGVRRLLARFDEVVEDIFYEPEEMIDAGERVILVLRWGGRGRGSGVEVEARGETWLMTVAGGKIVRVDEYATKQDALEAVSS